MHICGIDPGLGTTGYAVISFQADRTTVCDAGVCRTDPDAELPRRLAQIDRDVTELLDQFRPQVLGVEQLYSHYNHPRTAILMGHARGIILAVAAKFDIAVKSFTATQVKRYLTGNGRASKTQMQRAVQATLGLPTIPEPNDVADALAVALCCAQAVKHDKLELARK